MTKVSFTIACLLSLIIFSNSLDNECKSEMNLLHNKLNKVLYILEQHFNTKFGDDKTTYGNAKVNSGVVNPYSNAKVNSGVANPYSNVGGSSYTIPGYNVKSGYEDIGSGLYYEKGKGKEAELEADAHLKLEAELEKEQYLDNTNYVGDKKEADLHAAKQSLDKKEAYADDNVDASVFKEDFNGQRINNSVISTKRFQARNEQDTSVKYANDYNKENHEGAYKGNEIDVEYKDHQLQGGFNDKTNSIKHKASIYDDLSEANKFDNNGKLYEDEYQNYEDNEKDSKQRGKYFTYGDGNAPLYGKFNDGKDPEYPGLNDDIKDDKKDKYGYGGDGFGHQFGKDKYESSKDGNGKYFKNNYGANDAFNGNKNKKQAWGLEAENSQANAFNNGKYNDISAKGHNKVANYKGDYKNNKENHKTDFKFRNRESVDEFGTNERPNSLIVNDNTYNYAGASKKGYFKGDTKKGKYNDQEVLRKLGKGKKQDTYFGKDSTKGVDADAEFKVYTKAAKDKKRNRFGHKSGYFQPRKKY